MIDLIHILLSCHEAGEAPVFKAHQGQAYVYGVHHDSSAGLSISDIIRHINLGPCAGYSVHIPVPVSEGLRRSILAAIKQQKISF